MKMHIFCVSGSGASQFIFSPTYHIRLCKCINYVYNKIFKNHLSVLFAFQDVYSTGHSIDEANKLALSIISYVGCGISLLALTLALMTYLYHR